MAITGWLNGESDRSVREKVDDFCYLGSYLSSNGSCEKDVKVRIGKAAAVFDKMKKISKNDNISLRVKTRLYEAIILSTLLYGADVWPLTATLTKKTGCGTSHMAEKHTGHLLKRQDNKR